MPEQELTLAEAHARTQDANNAVYEKRQILAAIASDLLIRPNQGGSDYIKRTVPLEEIQARKEVDLRMLQIEAQKAQEVFNGIVTDRPGDYPLSRIIYLRGEESLHGQIPDSFVLAFSVPDETSESYDMIPVEQTLSELLIVRDQTPHRIVRIPQDSNTPMTVHLPENRNELWIKVAHHSLFSNRVLTDEAKVVPIPPEGIVLNAASLRLQQ